MTRLLVSVRSAEEAADALAAGAELIDVKEPGEGSLGAAGASVVSEVLEIVGGRVDVSAALGELVDDAAPDRAAALPEGVRFAKLGLSRCADQDWEPRWRDTLKRLPTTTQSVAVVYADAECAAAPTPIEILRAARDSDVRVLLIDTWSKSLGGLLAVWPLPDLADFAAQVRETGMMLVLAGGLRLDDVEPLMMCEPDYFAVRGAVCHGDRAGRLDPRRVETWRDRLAHCKPSGASR